LPVLLTFRDYELDTRLYALRCGGQVCQVEPLVFNLLAYLAQHRERIVTRQELMETLWAGKVVSDSTLGSCIKAARKAVGDNGEVQGCIATVHRRGYRFVAPVEERDATNRPHGVAAAPQWMPVPDENAALAPRRASLAVMPFANLAPTAEAWGGTADALAHDIITRLAQLRSLLVIAQGTVFALNEQNIGPDEAGRMLNVDYVVSGTVRRQDQRLIVTAELIETRNACIVWAEIFDRPLDDALLVLDEIGNMIVASTASEIEMAERNRAILKPPISLDAWEAHHRGLWHMYRFNRNDNEQARHFFDMAVRLDPTFARAYAGLSFTHFQNAFQGWGSRDAEIGLAIETACQSLSADERNPAAHWAMGRAHWLRGRHEQSVAELEQAIDLSPSFALGHYTLAFVQSQAGDPHAAISSSDHSRLLSPFDPLLFGMLGARAIALVRLGQFEEAAGWAVKAAARPNAHLHILALAAYSLALTGSLDLARVQFATIRKANPSYGISDFLAAFRLDPNATACYRRAAARIDGA
jgi:TolB-like protein/Tfp pilus assembly protein PilF